MARYIAAPPAEVPMSARRSRLRIVGSLRSPIVASWSVSKRGQYAAAENPTKVRVGQNEQALLARFEERTRGHVASQMWNSRRSSTASSASRHCVNPGNSSHGGLRIRAGQSLWLDTGEPDHLTPFFRFVGDELGERGGRSRQRHVSEVSQTGAQLEIDNP